LLGRSPASEGAHFRGWMVQLTGAGWGISVIASGEVQKSLASAQQLRESFPCNLPTTTGRRYGHLPCNSSSSRRSSPSSTTMPGTSHGWRRTPTGFVVNTTRSPQRDYLMLHRASCRHISGDQGKRWTDQYVKVCGPSTALLEEWAAEEVGGEALPCGWCQP